MAERTLTATRITFLELKDERRMVQEGYALLDEKRMLLASEMLARLRRYRALREAWLATLEAARAVMAWVRGALGWDEIISIIDPANARSIALGLRLGGRIDPARPGIDPGDVVIVHDLRGVAP